MRSKKLLADGADADLVRQEIEQAQAMGVSGVPFFIFGGRLGVPGAQEPSVLRQAMAQARQAMAESGQRSGRQAPELQAASSSRATSSGGSSTRARSSLGSADGALSSSSGPPVAGREKSAIKFGAWPRHR